MVSFPSAFTDVLDQTLEHIYSLDRFAAPTVILGM
jgi:hypothetical protein